MSEEARKEFKTKNISYNTSNI